MRRKTQSKPARPAPEQIGFRDEAIEPPFEIDPPLDQALDQDTQAIKNGLFAAANARELPITADWLRTQSLSNLSTAVTLSDEAVLLWEAGLADAARDKSIAAQECQWQGLLYGEKLLELAAGSFFLRHQLPVQPTGNNLADYKDFCDKLLASLEETGELDEREALFTERNDHLSRLWREWDRFVTQNETINYTEQKTLWQPRWDALYNAYLERTQALTDRKHNGREKADHTLARPVSVFQPGRNSTPSVLAPIAQALFSACHVNRNEFLPNVFDNRAGLEYAHGEQRVRVDRRQQPPAEILNAHLKQDELRAWIDAGEEGDFLALNLSQLDAMAWDVAALAVTAFYTRTDCETPDAIFPLLIDDYFDWRNIPSQHRMRETRCQVRDRIELLASDAVKIIARTQLHLPNSKTGRREATPVVTQGAYLDGKTEFWIAGQAPLLNLTAEPPDGYMTRLGSWAAPFIKQHTMIGLALRQLGEYNLKTQQWERRIGWYLTFQMNIQASKMKAQTVTREGKSCTDLVPQHSLKMETVLDKAHIPDWREIARVNPGRVVKQWIDALTTLHQDGIIGCPECLDGLWTGEDLKAASGKLKRGGLSEMQRRRYLFRPGEGMLHYIQAKNEAAASKRREALRRRTIHTPPTS